MKLILYYAPQGTVGTHHEVHDNADWMNLKAKSYRFTPLIKEFKTLP